MSRTSEVEIERFSANHIRVEEDDVEGATYVFDTEQHCETLIKNLSTLLEFDVLTDVSLIARDNHKYKFHSLLLACRSELFRKVLAATPLHFFQGELAPLNVDHKILKTLQKFIYQQDEVVDYDGDWNDLLDFASSFGFETMGSGFADSEPLLQSLHNMYEKQELTFCSLRVGACEFPCHSSVLAASSPVIFNLFESHPLSLQFGKIVNVNGIQSEGIRQILGYIYTSELSLTNNNVAIVMETASRLQFPAVGWACADYIMNRLRPDNAFGFLQFARIGHDINGDDYFDVLVDQSREYIVRSFSECIRHEEFLYLPSEEELLEYMSETNSDSLPYANLLPALLKWFFHSRAEREKAFPRLMTGACYLLDPEGFDHVVNKMEQ